MDTKVKADYGLDAPGVVRNLFIAAALGLGAFACVALHLWSGLIPLGGGVVLNFAGMPLAVGATCLAMALYMIWSSKVGKLGERDRLLDRIAWRGDEKCLDVGCGRGLLLIGAAKRASRGSATGADIWQTQDLSGNRPEATLANARREGVAERVKLETADMRKLPFADGAFDVITSMAAIHNLYKADERAAAMREIARVLAPGGHLLLDDIRHLGEYEAHLRASGLVEIERLGSRIGSLLLFLLTWGSLRPGQLIAKKPAA